MPQFHIILCKLSEVKLKLVTASVLKNTHKLSLQVHRLEVGDLVRVMRDRSVALQLQQGHGGWLKNQDTVSFKNCIYVDTVILYSGWLGGLFWQSIPYL